MLAPSTRVGRYEIKSALGKGGMGNLYIARDPNIDRLVALKLLSAQLDSDELKARFALEAKALASLNHPNIVDIYDSGEFRGTPFIVMEFVRGETLDEMIRRSAPVSLSRKLELIAQLCAGLAHAHEAGVIHRDIKPANLMVEDRSQRLKIVDFGIARVTESLTGRMTKVNTQNGTPGYMSPEQIEGGAIDQRSDLFAVGVVLYELLSNSTAFPGNSTRQIERKVLEEQPIPLETLLADLDPALQAIVDRALQKAPEDRYQSAAEFAEALHGVQERLPTLETGVRDGASTPAPGKGKASPPPLGKASKAEMAHQRCLTAYAEGAVDAAKRFAMEALVEDPAHAEARAFIRKVDPQMWVPPPPPRRGTVPPTHVSRATPSPKTEVTGGHVIEPTLLAGRRPELEPWDSQPAAEPESWDPYARTIVIRPGGEPTGRAPWAHTGPNTSAAGAGFEPTLLMPHHDEPSDWGSASPADPDQQTWDPYRPTVATPPAEEAAPRRSSGGQRAARPARRVPWVAVAWGLGVVALVAAAGSATWFLLLRGEDGVRLIIEKPEGGTISTDRLVCGSAGDACSASLPAESVVEFHATPDPGFKLSGFVGDCAPNGRTMMTGPRSCGATFEKIPDVPAAQMATLTITPATGGTVVGSGIECGGANKTCSAQHAVGTLVVLTAQADDGYRFRGFTGECGSGTTFRTTLSGPITCGPRFEITRPLAGPNGAPPGGAGRETPTSEGPRAGPPIEVRPPAGGGENRVVTGSIPAAGAGSEGAPVLGGVRSDLKPAEPPITDAEHAANVAKAAKEARERAEAERKKAEDEARENIKKALNAFLSAYSDLDLTAIQKVFPTAPDKLREQFRYVDTLAYTYAGEPEFKELDAASGRAVVEVDAKQVMKPKAGNRQEIAVQVTFELFKRDDSWLISGWTVKPKKK